MLKYKNMGESQTSAIKSADAGNISYEQRERIIKQMDLFKESKEVVDQTNTFFDFIKKYKAKGVDLEREYEKLPQSNKSDAMHEDFMKSKEHGDFAQFAEMLPLLANKEGRLGPDIHVKIFKTAKPDDAGNSFVDLVCEITNDKIKKDPKFKNVKPTVSFLVDMTTNRFSYVEKERVLQSVNLKSGKKGNVLCYENRFGVLGLDAPKCLVLKQEDYLASIADKFRTAMQAVPDKGFVISNEERFNEKYREFFMAFIESIETSCKNNVDFLLEQKNPTRDQIALRDSYQSIIDFCTAYKNTPIA